MDFFFSLDFKTHAFVLGNEQIPEVTNKTKLVDYLPNCKTHKQRTMNNLNPR